MTDVVAQNLWIDEKVAKAPNLGIVHAMLPPMPNEGDIAIYNGNVFRAAGGWDTGAAFPSGVTSARGVAANANGGILLAARRVIYTLFEEIWNSGLAGPAGAFNLSGITVDGSGDLWALGQRVGGNGEIWKYENSAWAMQFVVAWSSGSTGWHGIGVDSAGGVLLAGRLSIGDPVRIYRRFGGVLDSGTALPTGATSPHGFAVGANDEWFMVDSGTDLLYTRPAGGTWDPGIALPVAATFPRGVGVLPNGALVVADDVANLIYVNTLNNALLPAARGLVRWNGSQWQNL